MANTTTLKSVKVSARSVAATPPPVLMPKVLTKDDVAAAKSGNHITITDTDVTDYAGNAFEGQTGITYVDLSATSITGKIIDRDELPASATVFLPASNDDNSAKNIVIAGVCNDLQLNDAVFLPTSLLSRLRLVATSPATSERTAPSAFPSLLTTHRLLS